MPWVKSGGDRILPSSISHSLNAILLLESKQPIIPVDLNNAVKGFEFTWNHLVATWPPQRLSSSQDSQSATPYQRSLI